MSIAMMNEIQALKERMASLEDLVRKLAENQVAMASPPPSTLRIKDRDHGKAI